MITIEKGLDIPISGEPQQEITDEKGVTSAAVLGGDYIGLRPAMLVEEGDRVKLGQPLFADRKNPEVVFVAPGTGIVRQINRGPRRVLLSVVVELAGDEELAFESWSSNRLHSLGRDAIIDNLLASGLWTALRARPYGKVPDPGAMPSSIFVTAMDSEPLAPVAELIIENSRDDFANGLTIISQLAEGRVFVCQAPFADLPMGDADNITIMQFAGPHPSGLVGTHIHHLDPVSSQKFVWHLGYQDVIAIGKLFTSGRLSVDRIVALSGPEVKRPRLVRTRLGANTNDLMRGELIAPDCRVISGSVLSGHHATGELGYIGRFHNQVSAIAEAREETVRAGYFHRPKDVFTAYSVAVTAEHQGRKRPLTSALHGTPAAFVPLGGFERVMGLDVLPTQLLRALLVGDTDTAQALGCLELAEEDLALCSFVCPSKINYGPLLRACLDQIEKGE
ncbi:MAG: Na(+)-translocating NADH-quinone reductase subunit A [Hyphomicrobiales bacterium]|nr:Na(+)-translocating NADH-quinone reductase subunit A [Hyphomicrobiales bacterium]